MKKLIITFLVIFVFLTTTILSINYYVILSSKKKINVEIPNNIDCILVLGAGIWGDSPSPMLQDRLDTAIKLYKDGVSNKIIMTGDHGRTEYDEVNVMKQYAIDAGIPSSDIFMDHAGFSTYESMYRARDIFKAKNILIVTQEYHLYRAVFIANSLGLNAYGVNADPREYAGQIYRELREILARNKDFAYSIIKPKPTYLGEEIPVFGDGDITNDKEV